jgi:hypothetical protein
LTQINQKELEFYSRKLQNFPHFEYHHINLFYDLIDDKNYITINENADYFQKIYNINNSNNPEKDEIEKSELFDKIGSNYEKIYYKIIFKLKKIQKDLEYEVK